MRESNSQGWATPSEKDKSKYFQRVKDVPPANKDTGALLSWQAYLPAYCAAYSPTTGCTTNIPTTVEHHLTTQAGGSGASDVIWKVPGITGYQGFYYVVPTLQLEDGSYVGTASYYPQELMVNFDTSGHIRWSVPNDSPAIATVDGGLVGTSAVTYDQNGNATGQVVVLPTFGSIFGSSPGLATYSWTGKAYEIALGSVDEVTPPAIANATPPFWSFSGANPSANGTSPLCRDDRDPIVAQYGARAVGDIYYGQSRPRFTPTCFLFANSTSNSARSQYFSFNEINTPYSAHGPDDPISALIKYPLVAPVSSGYGLDSWRQIYNAPRIINSGYRDPNQNAQVTATHPNPNSRHQFGDAVDLQNQTCPNNAVPCSPAGMVEWNTMVTAAGSSYLNTNARADFTEPQSGPCGWACVHADWRYHDHGKYAH